MKFKGALASPKYFLVIILLSLISFSHGYMLGINPFRRTETLDSRGHFHLEWEVHWSSKRVTFNVTVKTRGYVAFGLSQTGDLDGADVVIGGVLEGTRSSYFWDGHGDNHGGVLKDWRQNWKLHSGWQSDSHTFLSFSRDLETCDGDDFLITSDRIVLIWAYGVEDNLHPVTFDKQGTFNVLLLDADYSPQIIHDEAQPKVLGKAYPDLKTWTVPVRLTMPRNATTYMCSMHKGPRLQKKHHLIGFNMHFNNPESRRHAHHLLIFRCHPPRGSSARWFFGPDVGRREECPFIQRPTGVMRSEYCTDLWHGFAVGGYALFAPPEVGYPMGLAADEYYLVQIHYDNPQRLSNVQIDLQLEFFYTEKLRPNDGGILMVLHDIPGLPPSLLVPPNAEDTIFGHCGGDCTKSMLPPGGVHIFGVSLHTHNSGRQLKLHHFRGRKPEELPWLAADLNFAFDFQHLRNLRQHTKLLPGDQVTMRCLYDSSWTNGTTVVGGLSTQQEMCVAFLHHYSKIEGYDACRSGIESKIDYRCHFLGVENATWADSALEFVVTQPEHLAGLTISEVSNKHVQWDPRRRAELRRFHAYHPQVNRCEKELWARDQLEGRRGPLGGTGSSVSYPYAAVEYKRESECEDKQ